MPLRKVFIIERSTGSLAFGKENGIGWRKKDQKRLRERWVEEKGIVVEDTALKMAAGR